MLIACIYQLKKGFVFPYIRILVEIDEILGDKETIDKSDLDKLEYTTAVSYYI